MRSRFIVSSCVALLAAAGCGSSEPASSADGPADSDGQVGSEAPPENSVATCSLTANTTASSTTTSNCSLLTRDVSSCKATRQAAGLSGAWLKFSCRVSLTRTTGPVTAVTDSRPDYKSNYFSTTDACYTSYKPSYPDPNSIAAQSISMKIPFTPGTTSSTMAAGVVGVALNGVTIYSNKAAGTDDIYQESGSFDECQGHPSGDGRYHYHSEPYAISSNDSNLIGVMRDGYFLYGRKDANGTTPTLDANGGHTGTTPDSTTAVYHYHVNLQTSTAAATAGQQVYFLTKGTYKGSPGACTGCL